MPSRLIEHGSPFLWGHAPLTGMDAAGLAGVWPQPHNVVHVHVSAPVGRGSKTMRPKPTLKDRGEANLKVPGLHQA